MLLAPSVSVAVAQLCCHLAAAGTERREICVSRDARHTVCCYDAE